MTRQANQISPIGSFDLKATILNGQTNSQVIDLYGNVLCGIFIPAAFTGTSITLKASSAYGGTFVDVYDINGGIVSITVSTGIYIYIDPTITASIRFLKLVSGSSEAADREIILATRPV